ncbi:YqzG/YhdC family protein [Virgibacillus doumboii]|uniref:YqzG/YhdC family protein n=1 Tax=Virgibacillus doumboii TaxID=2697503 RepID=UPI001FE398FC|nr:YqzG/YhdC family protein [Virgibacillus doumboii]
MRKVIIAFSVLFFLIPATGILQSTANAEKDIPSYAKWGRLAMKKTMEKYPDADIIDYLHKGKEVKEHSTVEKFKLWLKGDDREFGVFINIEFNTASEKIMNITFKETPN